MATGPFIEILGNQQALLRVRLGAKGSRSEHDDFAPCAMSGSGAAEYGGGSLSRCLLRQHPDLCGPRGLEHGAGAEKKKPRGARGFGRCLQSLSERAWLVQNDAASMVGNGTSLIVRAGIGDQHLADETHRGAGHKCSQRSHQCPFAIVCVDDDAQHKPAAKSFEVTSLTRCH